MMKLERLRIEKFRNVKPGADIRFADGFNIVLGRNGTGKTTLLDLISRIVRWDFSDLDREELAISYELTVDDARLDVDLANRKDGSSLVAPFVSPGFSGQHERFVPAMHARVQRGSNVTAIDVDDGQLRAHGKAPAVPSPSVATPSEALFVALTMAKHAGVWPFGGGSVRGLRFDESLDLFRMVWNSNTFPGGALLFEQGTKVPPLGLLPNSAPSDQWLDLFKARYHEEPTLTSFTTTDDKLGFLSIAVQCMGFVSAELRVDVLGRTGRRELGILELGNLIARFFFADGGFITQERLSYGQKRLLMFYYYLASNPDIVIADELVNGLHHQWITFCIDEIGQRQAFLTSQNPLLLDYLPFSSVEQAQKSFVLCTGERVEGQKPEWTWSNMSEEASNEFYSAYEVGIEHVSEILQSQGLF